MPPYLITTEEHVTGRYVVEASSPTEAQRLFENSPREVGRQIDYMAYGIEVETVEDYR